MKLLKTLSLLTLLLLSIPSVNAQESEAKSVITLERTACFGTCPMYTITILENGTILYEGGNFVQVTGEQTSEIAPEVVAMMVEAFQRAGYFEWDEAYTEQRFSDAPTIITSVTRDGQTHRIERYAGDNSAPLALPFLEQWIDSMVNSALWTGVEPDVSTNSNGSDTPLITLQSSPNFGFGPVYSVAAFEDGTIVFTGIAHVDEIGVQVFNVEASLVESLAQRAEISGYFNWQDSYEYRLMTDQATITTSIRWEDQFKRIVRYDGDPNAPIGLVRIETSIKQWVTELIGE